MGSYDYEWGKSRAPLRVLWGLGVRVLGYIVFRRAVVPRTWVISIVTLLLTRLITTHEPPSNFQVGPSVRG